MSAQIQRPARLSSRKPTQWFSKPTGSSTKKAAWCSALPMNGRARSENDAAPPSVGAMPTNIVQLESELRQITKTRTPPMSDADFAVNFKASSDNAVKAYYAEKKVLLDNLGKEANAAGFDLIPLLSGDGPPASRPMPASGISGAILTSFLPRDSSPMSRLTGVISLGLVCSPRS